MAPSPLTSRKLDLFYYVFFVVHLPIIFLVDVVPLYPPSLTPGALLALQEFYVTTYADQFFVAPPAWFTSYTWMELILHVPVCTWALSALPRDDRKTPLVLLVYAVHTAVTTFTCLIETTTWTMVTSEQRKSLAGFYVSYMAVSLLMAADMILRLNKILGEDRSAAPKTVRKI